MKEKGWKKNGPESNNKGSENYYGTEARRKQTRWLFSKRDVQDTDWSRTSGENWGCWFYPMISPTAPPSSVHTITVEHQTSRTRDQRVLIRSMQKVKHHPIPDHRVAQKLQHMTSFKLVKRNRLPRLEAKIVGPFVDHEMAKSWLLASAVPNHGLSQSNGSLDAVFRCATGYVSCRSWDLPVLTKTVLAVTSKIMVPRLPYQLYCPEYCTVLYCVLYGNSRHAPTLPER